MPTTRLATAGVDALETAANQMHVASVRLPLRASKEIAETLQSAAKKRIQAIVVFEDVWLTNQRAEVVNAASRHSLPVVSLYKDFPEGGGLFAYDVGSEPLVHAHLNLTAVAPVKLHTSALL